MALKVEGVLNRGVDGKKALCRARRLEHGLHASSLSPASDARSRFRDKAPPAIIRHAIWPLPESRIRALQQVGTDVVALAI